MSHVTCKPDWLAVDWGTTRLRVWLMRDDGSVIERRDSDKGMGRLEKDDFAPALTELVADALPARGTLPTIMCGMVGSRQGWAEAPYATAPCEAPGLEDATCFQSGALNVFILPGVKQTAPADVMRGEETQISGLVANEPAFDGALCLPGHPFQMGAYQ